MAKKTTPKILTTPLGDGWARVQADLADASNEQTAADVALVEASAVLVTAQRQHQAAVSRKTTAERKLSALRSKLGVEVAQ